MDRRPLAAWHVFLLVFAYLSAWALLRPPLQTPDEPQHLMKANSVRLQPWFNRVPDQFRLDPRSVNPLALETPAGLDKLFFTRINAMTAADIAATRGQPWVPSAAEGRPPYQRAIATYPQPFYWTVFLLAEPMVRLAGLSPWDATFVYRLVVAFLAAALWALVWRALQGLAEVGAAAPELLTFVVATPMLAFISSGVNPDAVNVPLCTLAILAAWRVLSEGRGVTGLALALLGAAMTKPSGLQLAAVLVAVVILLALARQVDRRRAGHVAIAAIGVVVASALVFYLWQPPKFLATGPSQDSLRQYLTTRWTEVPTMWRMYWGQLGWLDYWASGGWYVLIAMGVGVNILCVMLRPTRPARLAIYLGLVWVAFLASALVGELRYLREAGYTFQGRYLLPAGLAFGGVLLHEVRAARAALFAAIVALNIVLVQETVTRYYVDGWKGVVQALPFRD